MLISICDFFFLLLVGKKYPHWMVMILMEGNDDDVNDDSNRTLSLDFDELHYWQQIAWKMWWVVMWTYADLHQMRPSLSASFWCEWIIVHPKTLIYDTCHATKVRKVSTNFCFFSLTSFRTSAMSTHQLFHTSIVMLPFALFTKQCWQNEKFWETHEKYFAK